SGYGWFYPYNLLPCILVSKLWYRCFLPYLYCYFVEGQTPSDTPEANSTDPPEPWDLRHQRFIDTLRKNSHFFRRFQSYCSIKDEDLPFDSASPPNNLVGLFLFSVDERLADLLCYNQGPQLKQLIWNGDWLPVKIKNRHQDALMNLPCLEELELRNWIVSNELLTGILRTCSSTLKTLILEAIAGYDKEMFFADRDTNKYNNHDDGDENGTGVHSLVQLTSLTTLNMILDWTQSREAIYFPRICPALQSLAITVNMDEYDLSQLIISLRTCCPQLTSISYVEAYSMRHEYGYFPDPEIHASLFKDSTSCLKSMCTGLPVGLDSHMIDALLSQASTLEDLELRHRGNPDYRAETRRELDVLEVQKLLVQCRNLKRLVLSSTMFSIKDLEYLCVEPWVCRNLEKLVIKDYMPQEDVRNISEKAERHRRWIRQNAWPRRLRHHEYRWNEDDNIEGGTQNGPSQGQRQGGWFLKAGLTQDKFREALVDGEFKRKFLLHLSKTSGLKNLRYIRLNDLEFFRDEQPFEDAEEEKYEMEVEEGFVVDYQQVNPKKPKGTPALERTNK
ncbi:hypothetical protein BGX26_011152, partial [Mortierella sp. AD094]